MAPSETNRALLTSSLFGGLKFFLTRTLSHDTTAEVQELIEQHGGVVSSSTAGATQLVDYEKLDSRRPEWVSVDYIKDSVASGALQDPAKYSGLVFGTRPRELQLKGRARYSVEDDARLLHFAKLRGWTSMKSVPASAWKIAESDRVTKHTWQSMHEHFRKQLQTKTPMEQRAIMARASEIIRARLQSQEAEDEDTVVAPARTPPSGTAGQELTTPASTGSIAAREASVAPVTSSAPRRRQVGERTHQKRKRGSPASVSAASSPAIQENEETDNEHNADETTCSGGTQGIFFKSVWAELSADPTKRPRVQALFHASMEEGTRRTEVSTTETMSNTACSNEAPIEIIHQEDDNNGEEQEMREVNVHRVTDAETDEIICQLQIESNQDMSCVVHALYYCSGNTDMARAFLKGAAPSGMWSPEDDLLLVNLVIDENLDRSAVDAAVARGDFASMQVPRDTDAILDRVQFLR